MLGQQIFSSLLQSSFTTESTISSASGLPFIGYATNITHAFIIRRLHLSHTSLCSFSFVAYFSRTQLVLNLERPFVQVRLESFSFETQPIMNSNNSQCFPLAIFRLRPISITTVIVFSNGAGTLLITIVISVAKAISFRPMIRLCKESTCVF
jgi:hypothetical protein